MVRPSLEEFKALAVEGNVVPVYAQIASDFETPLSAYLKIRDGRHAFLLESTDASGRWSMFGSSPRFILTAKDGAWSIERRGGGITDETKAREDIQGEGDPLIALEKEMASYKPAPHPPDLPPFTGGAVGYLGGCPSGR